MRHDPQGVSLVTFVTCESPYRLLVELLATWVFLFTRGTFEIRWEAGFERHTYDPWLLWNYFGSDTDSGTLETPRLLWVGLILRVVLQPVFHTTETSLCRSRGRTYFDRLREGTSTCYFCSTGLNYSTSGVSWRTASTTQTGTGYGTLLLSATRTHVVGRPTIEGPQWRVPLNRLTGPKYVLLVVPVRGRGPDSVPDHPGSRWFFVFCFWLLEMSSDNID